MKSQKIRGVEKMKNNGNIDSVFERYRSHGMTGTGKTTGCPTKEFGHDRRAGFTLVELVIVIAIVIILSVISVPIYRGYVDKSKMAEGYALLGTILSAQKAYYSEYGNFYYPGSIDTVYDPVLGIDARGNKYFTLFRSNNSTGTSAYGIVLQPIVLKPRELWTYADRWSVLQINYNMTTGAKFVETDW